MLLLQNEVPEAANVAAARAVKAQGGRVVLNAAPARKLSGELIALVDIVIVNAIEAEFLAGVPVVDTLDGAAEAARRAGRCLPGRDRHRRRGGGRLLRPRGSGVRAGRDPGEGRQHPWRGRRICRRVRRGACAWPADRGGHCRRQRRRGLAGVDAGSGAVRHLADRPCGVSSVTPPSVLPDISPSRGEIGSHDPFRQSATLKKGRGRRSR